MKSIESSRKNHPKAGHNQKRQNKWDGSEALSTGFRWPLVLRRQTILIIIRGHQFNSGQFIKTFRYSISLRYRSEIYNGVCLILGSVIKELPHFIRTKFLLLIE